MRIEVSVVVPTCDRPALLDRCLHALIEQNFPPDAYEIVVADDARSDVTRCQIERLSHERCREGPAVRYVRPCATSGPAAARNAGWREARGCLIAFTDDDCIPATDWLTRGVEAMREGWAMAGGRVHVPPVANPTDYERNASLLGESEFVTANCFIRRETLVELNGFDERFRVAWREDSDLLFRAIEAGLPVGSAPDAIVCHPIRPAPWGISATQQRKSMYNALLFKKHPHLYRERIQSSPPWRYYRILMALLTGLGGLAAGRRHSALAGFTVWTLLTAKFCWDRLRGTRHTPGHVGEMIVTSAVIPPLSVYWRIRGAITHRVFFL